MALLRGNLHTHSTLSDGQLTPEEVVRAYRELGYDFVAFTDHRCFLGPSGEEDYWARLPESTSDLLVLAGIEEEPAAIQGRHMGRILGPGGEELRILNHPSEYGLTIDETIRAVREVDAHAVEVTCHGRYLELYDTAAIDVPKVATDDAHFAYEIGVAWIEVDARRDADAILRAVKNADFHNFVAGRRLT